MANRHKHKRSDDAQIRQPANAPVAEAIALGTAAGSLVIGAMQAHAETLPSVDDAVQLKTTLERAERTAPAADDTPAVLPADVSAVEQQPVLLAQQPSLVRADISPAQTAEPTARSADPSSASLTEVNPAVFQEATADATAVPNTIPLPVSNELVQELAGQMQAIMAKAIDGAATGVSSAELSLAVATDIVGAAQQIVAGLNLEGLTQQTANLADDILTEIDAPGIINDVLAETGELAPEIAGVAGLPMELLGAIDTPDLSGTLIDLPSALLGNDGPEESGGLLSEMFYPDGEADLVASVTGSLAISDLGLVASSLVGDAASGTLGFLGTSYTDLPTDAGHSALGGLNSLSLL